MEEPTVEPADYIGELQKLKDELPEEEKQGNMGRMIAYIVNLTQSGWSFLQVLENIDELDAMGKHMERVESIFKRMGGTKKAVLKALDYQKKNCSEGMKTRFYATCVDFDSSRLDDIYDDVAKDKIIDYENTKKVILDSMRSCHQDESNQMIKNMAKGSAYVALVQCVRLFFAWKKISAASNVIQNRYEFTVINEDIEKMKKMVTELLDLCERNPNDSSISRKVIRINTLFNMTLGKISNLKVNMNGHIQSLDLLANYSAVDGLANLATAGTQGYQLWQTWSNLASSTKNFGVVSVAVFTGLAFGNIGIYYLSQNKLKELKKSLEETTRLQRMLQDVYEQAAQAIEEMQ